MWFVPICIETNTSRALTAGVGLPRGEKKQEKGKSVVRRVFLSQPQFVTEPSPKHKGCEFMQLQLQGKCCGACERGDERETFDLYFWNIEVKVGKVRSVICTVWQCSSNNAELRKSWIPTWISNSTAVRLGLVHTCWPSVTLPMWPSPETRRGLSFNSQALFLLPMIWHFDSIAKHYCFCFARAKCITNIHFNEDVPKIFCLR